MSTSFFFFWLYIRLDTLRILRKYRESAKLLVNINAHAQASAESLPAELSRVDFHLSHLYPNGFPYIFQYVLAFARRVRYSVRSRTSFLLPPVFRSTIASLRSAKTRAEYTGFPDWGVESKSPFIPKYQMLF